MKCRRWKCRWKEGLRTLSMASSGSCLTATAAVDFRPFIPALTAVSSYLPSAGGVQPPVLTRERLIVERRAMRHSKTLNGTLLKPSINFLSKVTYQVNVWSKAKVGDFRFTVDTSKLEVLGQNFLEIQLNHRGRK